MSEQSTPRALTPDQLRRVCQIDLFTFQTTAELQPTTSIIGQPRGTRAIEFGIHIENHGYNIYVLGETGTGRTTTIRRFLEERAGHRPVPDDWVYVYNYSIPHQPRAISLPAGQGLTFRADVTALFEGIRDDLPKLFDTDAYKETVEAIGRKYDNQQEEMLNGLRHEAARQNFALINTASGPVIAPVQDGKVMPPEQFQSLPLEQQQALREQQELLNGALGDVLDRLRRLDSELRVEFKALNRQVADGAIDHYFVVLKEKYADHDEAVLFLSEMRQDILDHLDAFAPAEDDPQPAEIDLRRYEVNLLVDNSQTQGAPVIVEPNPTLYNLIGRIEYELQYGVMSTHFMNLKAGSLHRANGGYLVVNARDILSHPTAWEALKRAIVGTEILLQTDFAQDGGQPLAKTINPEPIPLSVKIVMLGSPGLFYALYEAEEDFGELFKVKADFDTSMVRDSEHELAYAHFIANRCHEERLLHFDRTAVGKVIEYGSKLAGDQNRLSTRFGTVADLIREASYWASTNQHQLVVADDVQHALSEQRYRANLMEELLLEEIRDGTVFIDTQGVVVGQVNGLSVLDMGDYTFGRPSRITARTFMGEAGVINIEREVELAGPLHNKGVLILAGYLGGTYAQYHPLSVSASLTFEQNYSGIDGDSASSTELYALLSSLSGLPIKQAIAATGSVNQRGEVQPIGGATEKIEGYFGVCQVQGLTGEQGVMVPESNARHLMLREDVVAAVAAGQFHIWPVRTIDEGIAILTGVPAGEANDAGEYPPGTVHYLVQNRLHELAEDLKHFGQDEDD
jgi:predicted ATP-dependent protease